MSNNVKEEVLLQDTTKQILEDAITKYYEYHSQYKAMEATKEVYNKLIKETFEENNLNKYTTSDGIKASITITNKPIFDEDKLIEFIKSTGVKGIIKTKEYIDMEALENALYHGEIKASDLKPFKTEKVTKTLRCTKPQILKEN